MRGDPSSPPLASTGPLVPLLLAVTGISMMLVKRRMRRARKLQRAAEAAAGG